MFKKLLFFSFTLLQVSAIAQHTFPTNNAAFLQNEVATVRITLDADSLDELLSPDNYYNEREFPAQFVYESSVVNQTIPLVGFRLRGNTSLFAQKKSFKVSFNTYSNGGNWQGIEKMNLNGSHNDPSMIRAKLSWETINNNELAGSRSSFVKLYINDEYRGLYSNIEHIDEVFAAAYFDGSGDGNLYKCLYPANFAYLNDNPESYKFESNGRRAYELKTNDWVDDYSDLANFIKVLNQTNSEALPCELEQIFNVDNYLKYLAIDVLIGNWDNYAYNQNNFYLYHNQLTGLLEYIPYDLDNTWGVDWVNQTWTSREIYNWSYNGQPRPLYTRLLEVPEYKARFSYYIQHYATTTLQENTIATRVNQLLNLIEPAVFDDLYRTYDYGFTLDDFQNSGTIAWGNQIEDAIIPYITARNASAIAQVDAAVAPAPKIAGWIDGVLASNPVIRGYCKNCPTTSIGWEYSLDGVNWQIGNALSDNGITPDAVINDGIYSATVNSAQTGTEFKFRFVSSTDSINYTWPCIPLQANLAFYPDGIVINEAMSSNQTTIADENGGFGDWLELYNSNSATQTLSGYFLTDDAENPNKFPLPSISIAPSGFRLFWADSDEEFGRNHCNFKISANGESLWLIKSVPNGYKMVNYIDLPAMNPDVSYGRIQDGSPSWIYFAASTPNASNNETGIADFKKSIVLPFPNPTSSILNFKQNIASVIVLDIAGKVVDTKQNCTSIDLSGLAKAVYFVNADGQIFRVVKL